MRKILFRGKVVGENRFAYGDLQSQAIPLTDILEYEQCEGYGDLVPVIPETVGQYTGLTDKNGTKIFEGDILRVVDGMGDTLPYVVFWSQENCAFDWKDSTTTDYFYKAIADNSIIIGNIHENPALLEAAKSTKEEFAVNCVLAGYCSKAGAERYCIGKDELTDADYIAAYRQNERVYVSPAEIQPRYPSNCDVSGLFLKQKGGNQ